MPYYFTPFRSAYKATTEVPAVKKPCVFCNHEIIRKQSVRNKKDVIYENDYYWWVVNWFPRAEAHTMLIPKRHITCIEDERDEELLARQDILKIAMQALTNTFGETGFEFFLQTGPGSLSSIEHLHWHLIPTTPQKELLSLAKVGYFYTTQPEEEKIVMQPIELTLARELLIHTIAEKN
jgi:histidine triad (HIT) family protein